MEETRQIFRGFFGAIVASGIDLKLPVISMGSQWRSEAVFASLSGAPFEVVKFKCHSFFFPQESFRWSADFCHSAFVATVLVAVVVDAASAAAAAERFFVGAIVVIVIVIVIVIIEEKVAWLLLFLKSSLEFEYSIVLLRFRRNFSTGTRLVVHRIAMTSKSLEDAELHRVLCIMYCVYYTGKGNGTTKGNRGYSSTSRIIFYRKKQDRFDEKCQGFSIIMHL